MDYDIDELRDKLLDYYGTAMGFYPVAVMDLARVENMSDEEVIEEAIKLGYID